MNKWKHSVQALQMIQWTMGDMSVCRREYLEQQQHKCLNHFTPLLPLVLKNSGSQFGQVGPWLVHDLTNLLCHPGGSPVMLLHVFLELECWCLEDMVCKLSSDLVKLVLTVYLFWRWPITANSHKQRVLHWWGYPGAQKNDLVYNLFDCFEQNLFLSHIILTGHLPTFYKK